MKTVSAIGQKRHDRRLSHSREVAMCCFVMSEEAKIYKWESSWLLGSRNNRWRLEHSMDNTKTFSYQPEQNVLFLGLLHILYKTFLKHSTALRTSTFCAFVAWQAW